MVKVPVFKKKGNFFTFQLQIQSCLWITLKSPIWRVKFGGTNIGETLLGQDWGRLPSGPAMLPKGMGA